MGGGASLNLNPEDFAPSSVGRLDPKAMNRILLGLLAIASCCLASSRAELDGKTWEQLSSIHCSFEVLTAHLDMPLLVTVTDSKGVPVANATVALMRIEDDGFSEADVIAASNPRTDASGRALLNYPATLQSLGPVGLNGPDHVNLIGAITVIHPDFATAQVELSSQYPQPFKVVNPPAVPWVKVILARSRP
jgi:hypothetical protein